MGTENPEVLPALIEALKDPSPAIRRQVANALGNLGPSAEAAVPALVATTRDPDDWVRHQAFEALKKIRAESKADEDEDGPEKGRDRRKEKGPGGLCRKPCLRLPGAESWGGGRVSNLA